MRRYNSVKRNKYYDEVNLHVADSRPYQVKSPSLLYSRQLVCSCFIDIISIQAFFIIIFFGAVEVAVTLLVVADLVWVIYS